MPKSSCEPLVNKTWPLLHHSRTGQTLHLCLFTTLLPRLLFDCSFSSKSCREMVKLGVPTGTGTQWTPNSSRGAVWPAREQFRLQPTARMRRAAAKTVQRNKLEQLRQVQLKEANTCAAIWFWVHLLSKTQQKELRNNEGWTPNLPSFQGN